jgi:lysophospholipase L1-like esterase
MGKRPDRARGLLANLTLAAATLAVALLAAEAVVRLLTRQSPSLLVTDPVVGKRFRPGFAGRVHVPECDCEVDVRFDRDGLRNPSRPQAPAPGVTRVALLGDSMVAAIATAEERTAARQLEWRLQASLPGRRLEVLNAGVSSSSTASELALYREVVSRYRPALVVLVFWVGNDLADNSLELTRAPRLYFELDRDGRLEPRPVGLEPDPLADWLDRNSRLYVWQKTALRQARAAFRARRAELEAVDLVFASPEPPVVSRAWALTGAIVRELARECAERGSQLVLVAAPAAAQVYDDLWGELSRRARGASVGVDREHPERRMAKIAAEADIPFLALVQAFRERTPSRSSLEVAERLYYEGRFHWNDEGNGLVAEALAAFLAPILEERSPARARVASP